MQHPADDKRRVEDVAQTAADAFWQEVATRYDEVKGGDLDPPTTHALMTVMESAIRAWLHANYEPPRPFLTLAQAQAVAAALSDPNTAANAETVTDAVGLYRATGDDCERAGISYPDGSVIRMQTGAHLPFEQESARTFIQIIDGDGAIRDNYESN